MPAPSAFPLGPPPILVPGGHAPLSRGGPGNLGGRARHRWAPDLKRAWCWKDMKNKVIYFATKNGPGAGAADQPEEEEGEGGF